MTGKDIDTWDFFDGLMKNCGKAVFMDGDVSERTLRFACHYGATTYVNNVNQATTAST